MSIVLLIGLFGRNSWGVAKPPPSLVKIGVNCHLFKILIALEHRMIRPWSSSCICSELNQQDDKYRLGL
ncbi:Uncharacterized protein HZ326_8381 [Fusarium oxysporum f. sp. albedinis]|nr:Uncharacterized protein HZ326_8381 [Fusarium oxysporum f. sp. albedinis]